MKKTFKNFLKIVYYDSILKNSIYLIATNALNGILGFFFWMMATKYYTPNDIGIISAILSSTSLISILSLIGLPVSLIFYLPRHVENANKIINSCLIISIIISIIFSLIFILGIEIWSPKLRSTLIDLEIIVVFITIAAMTNISSLMSGTFTAGKRSSFHMIKENIFSFIKILSLILFAGFGAIGILLSWSFGLIMAVMAGFFLLFKLWKYAPMPTIDPIVKNMASYSIKNYISGIFYNLPKFIFPIMIVNLISAESGGYFFIAMTIAGILYGIPLSIASSFLAESADKDKFYHNIIKVLRFNMLLLIPALLLFLIFGKFILTIFNPNYANNSFLSLVILSIASIPMSLIIIYHYVLNAQNRLITGIKINMMIAIVALMLSIPFIKMWNIEGVALSYLVANIFTAIIIIFRIKRPIEFTVKTLNFDSKNIVHI